MVRGLAKNGSVKKGEKRMSFVKKKRVWAAIVRQLEGFLIGALEFSCMFHLVV